MLTKAQEEALAAHRPTGWFYRPLRGFVRRRALSDGEGLESFVGERPDGAKELVRRASGPVALELLLNEQAAVRRVRHKGLVEPLWTARTGAESLATGFRFREPMELAYPLDLRWLLRSFLELARVVGALHAGGILHGDLKPEAVSFAEDPGALLLWDLRLAQEPGPRRFEAFSARFAAPEQVAGGELGYSCDVHALGVMLYSLFIRERFPTILLPRRATVDAGAPSTRPPLSAITAFAGLGDEGEVEGGYGNVAATHKGPAARPPDGGEVQGVLGAKILFALELERVVRRTADIGVAKELLAAIERATAQKPARRWPDGGAFAEELARLLALAEELAG